MEHNSNFQGLDIIVIKLLYSMALCSILEVYLCLMDIYFNYTPLPTLHTVR